MDILLIIVPAAFWGGSFLMIKSLVSEMDVVTAVFLRLLFALISVKLIFIFAKKSTAANWRIAVKPWIAGLFAMCFPYIFLFWGETRVSPGVAGIINGSVPVWSAILAYIFIRNDETFSWNKISGIAVGLLGFLALFYKQISFTGVSGEFYGILAVLGMALCYSVSTIMTRKILLNPAVSFQVNLYHQHISSFLFIGVIAVVLGKLPTYQHFTSLTVMAQAGYLGFLSNAVGMIIYYALLKKLGVIKASAIIYITPIMTLIWEFLFHKTLPRQNEIIGAVFILLGVALIEIPGRLKK